MSRWGWPGDPRDALTPSLKDAAHLVPTFLPDNRHFVYLRVSRVHPSESGLMPISHASRSPKHGATGRDALRG